MSLSWLWSVIEVEIRRGDLVVADLSPVVGSEQGGLRPVLVIQNDIGNRFSPTVIVAAVTSQIEKSKLPTHVELSAKVFGLTRNSVVLLEQVRTIDKRRIQQKLGRLDLKTMELVDEALAISMGLVNILSPSD